MLTSVYVPLMACAPRGESHYVRTQNFRWVRARLAVGGLRRRRRGVRPRTRGPRLAFTWDRAYTRGGAADRASLRGDGRLRLGDHGRRGPRRLRRRRDPGARRARPAVVGSGTPPGVP